MDLIAEMQTLTETDRPISVDVDGEWPEDLTLPPIRYEKLEVNGETFDLRRPEQAQAAQEAAEDHREALRAEDLDEYEDRPTKPWGGGRSRLLHDELRAKMAVDFHEGKHDLSWEQQEIETKRIISIRAAQFRAQGN